MRSPDRGAFMTRVSILLACILLMSSFATAAGRRPPAKPLPVTTQTATPQTADPDTDAMRADLQRMRTLVGQMQRNLGFVDSGLTPLKHQFELEIEMWNVLINDMQ